MMRLFSTCVSVKCNLLLLASIALLQIASASPIAKRQGPVVISDLPAILVSTLTAAFESSLIPATPNGTALLNETLSPLTNGSYQITQNASDPAERQSIIDTKRATFLYGPPVAGGPYFPNGVLGLAKDNYDQINLQSDLVPELTLTDLDAMQAVAGYPQQYGNLSTLEDYTKLYVGEWNRTLPNGPDPGVETNYTQDLLFSMERLSISPYAIRRLNPCCDQLAFPVHNAKRITGWPLHALFDWGYLFYADFRDQKNLTSTGRYAAAVDAYFYINPSSGDFLPLAIRTNVGANLIYTPEDSPSDWLLAKMMYNVNDFWFAQWNHLSQTHEVVQISWMAAIRTLGRSHPVYAILNRLTYEVFAIQLLAKSVLFLPGTAVDLIFPYVGIDAQRYATNRYFSGGAGRFQANYFRTNLRNRGLIESYNGPELTHFPFYEDGAAIWDAIHDFMESMIDSFYDSDSEVAQDDEIQAWASEANGPAKAIDFPDSIPDKGTLVDILTHFGHLVSTAHHTVNTNELLQVSSTLPFHPPSLYQPLPTQKSNNTNVVSFLPPFDKVIEQFSVGALFARPLFINTTRSLIHMFDDPLMLSLMNEQTTEANAAFMAAMTEFSNVVGNRTFDENGLSQGMPFVWQALDPKVAPYSITT